MSKVFFRVGGEDLTPRINIRTYDVNSEPVYNSWTDGDLRLRRNVTRTRIAGKIEMGYTAEADLLADLALIEANTGEDGSCAAEVYCNNTAALVSSTFYLTTDAEGSWDTVNNRQWLTLTLEIEEV